MTHPEKQIYISAPYLHMLTLILVRGTFPDHSVIRFTDFADFLNQVKDILPAQDRQQALDGLIREELRMMNTPEEEIYDVKKP